MAPWNRYLHFWPLMVKTDRLYFLTFPKYAQYNPAQLNKFWVIRQLMTTRHPIGRMHLIARQSVASAICRVGPWLLGTQSAHCWRSSLKCGKSAFHQIITRPCNLKTCLTAKSWRCACLTAFNYCSKHLFNIPSWAYYYLNSW